MTHPSFDLIEQPWIPVLHLDGATTETLGLRELFHRAHELQAVYGESPLVTAALYRLLLALLYAIYGDPQNTQKWKEMWFQKRFDPHALDEYFSRWQERFDLFHPQRPFFQWPEKANREKLVIDLLPDYASGGNATLFDHHTTMDNSFMLADQAARALLLVMTFSTAGGSGMAPKESSDAPWARGCVFLVEGNSIFETLMLNYLPSTESDILPTPDDQPFWEAEDPFTPQRNFPLGIQDYLTWPIRAIHLIPESQDGEWVVRTVRLGTGLKLNEITHPMYAYYVRARDQKRLFLRFDEKRALWRLSGTFLNLYANNSGRASESPKTIYWLSELVEDDILPSTQLYRLMVLGMSSNQAKVDFYREEHFPLPGKYLEHPELVENLSDAITLAEDVYSALKRSISRLATLLIDPAADEANRSTSGKGNRKGRDDVKNLMSHWAAGRMYWANLEPVFFTLLQNLTQDQQAALEAWQNTLRNTAYKTFLHTASKAGESTRALRAAARAENQLWGSLKKLFESNKE